MKDARNGGSTGVRTRQRLDHLADFGCADSFHKHFPNGTIQLIPAAMIALKQLRLIALSRSWHGQIWNLSDGGFQTAGVMSIALIATPGASLVGLSPDKRCHFFFQYTHECEPNGVLEPLFHHLFKRVLTSDDFFATVFCVSHRYPPDDFELSISSGYQTSFLHTTQYTAGWGAYPLKNSALVNCITKPWVYP